MLHKKHRKIIRRKSSGRVPGGQSPRPGHISPRTFRSCTYKENTDLPEIPDEKQIDDFMASVHERIVRGEM